MRGVWTTDRVKAAEQKLFQTVPESTLMRRAAFGVAVCAAELRPRKVLLLVGAGNNGGDALWAGAFLRRRGIAVDAILLKPERAHAAGLAAYRRAGGRIVAEPGPADVVIDGIVGISGKGALRPDAAKLVERITAPIIAVDLPSGVDPDTGAEDGPCVDAAITVTFGGRKPVHALSPRCGEVRVLDIGLGAALGEPDFGIIDRQDVAGAWPVPGPDDDKYTQGVTGIAAGSATYPGAAVLSASGAVLATSGLVRYAGTAAEIVGQRWPEVVVSGAIEDAGRVQAWVVGPGVGTGGAGRELMEYVLGVGVPVCVDADGITLLSQHPALWDRRDPDTPLVLTPHDREFARLAPLGKDRVASAKSLARRVNAVVLLKGYNTIVAAPDGRVLVNQAPSAWLATAGSGDVLSGILGALLAAGIDPWLAAGCAAYAHAHAGTYAASGAPAPASAIAGALPETIRWLRD
ncbi:bifunctional ADP-dependent (S)-NAD(P)H-hydrate dehydratase/NAD(P)H-hydrate epimerase [Actinosynnema sp. ALI-1.44]|uniref:bifunctional ADP-dependent NAD(P)H-hydrate dehydratase/NAD(P)H-hydrate epimerase n=1 Tax=Actinosynnema sp. ALI-1.44 TaxID=1933779 RepID=UPI00097C4852|nr:bifunctional ADP-dependent NAD(P)H-hydrate dehydratase/NAD(P)H-hydrate epimerase [Actinosynnema sp. ALI-1.44]ONI73396.1 bifunctional ADP-dependent (S)-NAD(P)H-hydrate dehydratase/NAD(P)H-hydrate epimerase [Actinosynnema sp. ALI-1.44]